MEGLSHLALVSDKKIFDKFYQPRRPNRNDNCSDFQLLLERDSSGMTCLHRAASYADAKNVNEILENIRKHFSFSRHPATNKLVIDYVGRDIKLAAPYANKIRIILNRQSIINLLIHYLV